MVIVMSVEKNVKMTSQDAKRSNVAHLTVLGGQLALVMKR